jgi:hypothetical protein
MTIQIGPNALQVAQIKRMVSEGVEIDAIFNKIRNMEYEAVVAVANHFKHLAPPPPPPDEPPETLHKSKGKSKE